MAVRWEAVVESPSEEDRSADFVKVRESAAVEGHI
jgi:hypothetical protein